MNEKYLSSDLLKVTTCFIWNMLTSRKDVERHGVHAIGNTIWTGICSSKCAQVHSTIGALNKNFYHIFITIRKLPQKFTCLIEVSLQHTSVFWKLLLLSYGRTHDIFN